MAATVLYSATTALIARNASSQEKEHFRILWGDHLRLRDQGKIVYFVPHTLGTQMGAYVLRQMANRLSTLLETDVYTHFDVGKLAYRIGQIFDDLDRQAVSGLVFVYKADYAQVDNGNPTQSNLAPSSSSLGNNYHLETNSTTSRNNLASSEQKVAKIPKPRNMWIIYRQEKHNIVLAENPGMHTSSLSTIISNMWRNESVEVRAHYQKLAKEEKSKHALQYPEYKCSPRKSSEIMKRKRGSKKTLISIKGAPAVERDGLLSEENMQDAMKVSKKRRTNSQVRRSGILGSASYQQTPNNSFSGTNFLDSADWEVGDGLPAHFFSDR